MAARKTISMDPHEEMVRLLAVQLRRSAESQTAAIMELSKAGFGPSRIAELLGTSAHTVSVTLDLAKRRAKKERSGRAPAAS